RELCIGGDAEQGAVSPRFINFADQYGRGGELGEVLEHGRLLFELGVGRHHQYNLIGRRDGNGRAEFFNLFGVVGASAGGVDEDEVVPAERAQSTGVFVGIVDDVYVETDDVGVHAQLIGRGDAVGVGRDECDACAFAYREVGGQFGEIRSFAYAGCADKCDDAAFAGMERDAAGDLDFAADLKLEALLEHAVIAEAAGIDAVHGVDDEFGGVATRDPEIDEAAVVL